MALEINPNDIEFVLYVFSHPEKESEEAFQLWIQEEGHLSLYKELRNLREAGLVEFSQPDYQVEDMWRRFERRFMPTSRWRLIGWAASIAAMMIVGIGLSWWVKSTEQMGEVLAQTEYELGKGVVLVAENKSKTDSRKQKLKVEEVLGVETFVQDSLRGIVYPAGRAAEKEEVKYHTLRVPRAADYLVVLEDSTCVWVNAESELRYPAHFSDDERTVELKGEAYFKVHPDSHRPFRVRTQLAETRVLGTEFNLQAYSGCSANITLVKGSIGVKPLQPGSREVVLRPGQNALLTDGRLEVEEVDVLKYISWKDGFFYYDNVCLEDILEELGRWYDFSVSYRDIEVQELCFKFWAGRYEPAEQVLNRLCETQKVKFLYRDHQVIVDKYRE